MKKIVLFLIVIFTLNACSSEDEHSNNHYEVLPVNSFIVPKTFTLGETYVIKMKYKRPSSCHYFQGVYYEKNLNTRTIAVQTSVLEENSCKALDTEPLEVSFNFYVTNTGSYIFKFYKGEDAAGKNIFEEVEIKVVSN